MTHRTPSGENRPQLWAKLGDEDVADGIEAQIGPANLILPPSPVPTPDGTGSRNFQTNESFWDEVLSEGIHANTQVTLDNFFLSEWFPRSPGLFHTGLAWDARRIAESSTLPLSDEERRLYESTGPPNPHVYDICGKVKMLSGGLGCIRLLPKATESGLLWFMSASSSMSAHEGVPIALTESLYGSYIDRLTEHGVFPCTLTGKLRFLPEPLLSLYRDYTGVRRLYLQIEEIQPVPLDPHDLSPIVSVAVMFESPLYDNCAAYVSFTPGIGGSIWQRLSWLEHYVATFYNGIILTDFDEQMTRFRDAVFSLDKICNGRLSGPDVRSIVNKLYFEHAEIDTFIQHQHELNKYRVNEAYSDHSVEVQANYC
jgi:hypothetical protein